MSQLTITINGRPYQVACDDGQEEHLRQLAGYIDKRVGELSAAMGQIGDARLLVMTSLLIADELADAYAALDEERKKPRGIAPETEAALAQGIEALAARIENIAARLEAA
ncbi:MAG TPA: cell division protein ZapA [Alphaproteobacteria bacterium]|nr:cell division protein ZapA [Alphaproteobacteria bacterium]